MKRSIADWGKVLLLLLDEAVVLLVLVLALRFFGIYVPLPVTIIMVLVVGSFVFIIHKSVIDSFHRRQVTGREGMIGLEGRVVEPLTPVGAIVVHGENWRAQAVDGNIQVDENVVIVELDGLTLKVKRKEQQLRRETRF
jgi:membrane-bound ClpP family serine protease